MIGEKMEAPLRVAVIGCGPIGVRHARAVFTSREAMLVAACDPIRERALTVCAGTAARAYADLEALLAAETLDAVTVATPDALHVEPVLKALEAGCHVFCEKPLALSLAEARTMAQAAAQRNRQLAVDYNRRFGFGYAKGHALLTAGEIGTVTNGVLRVSDGVPPSAVGNGPYAMLYLLLTHHIDLLRWFCGEIVSVQALCANAAPEGYFREVALTFAFAGGAVGTLAGGWRPGQSRTIESAEFGGTGGILFVDDVQKSVRRCGLDLDALAEFRPSPFGAAGTAFYDSLTAHLHGFLACLRAGEAVPVSGEEGVRGLEIVEAAILAHETRTRVSV
jgi:predicted dehydrogenase